MKSKKEGAGRPSKISEETVKEFKQYMIAGLTLKDACSLLEIDTSTWRRYEKKHPDIAVKRKRWQGMLKAQAQANIAKEIMSEKDAGWSAYLMKREMQLEEKRAQNALARAQAKESKARFKNIEMDTRIKQAKVKAAERLTDVSDDKLDELLNLLAKEGTKNPSEDKK